MDGTYWIEIALIGISLSMDALAVSVAMGTAERKSFTGKKIAITALMFGGFQALMPLLGWVGIGLCGSWVRVVGKIGAALLLWLIGGKMILDRNKEEKTGFGFRALLLLAFATSIDALLVGVSFGCLGYTSVGAEVVLIGCITAVISAAGGLAGRVFGDIFGNKCELAGGLTLIAIGVKVLIFG